MTRDSSSTRTPKAPFLPPVAIAVRQTLSQGYSLSDLRADVLAGLVVGIVALPLSMALAVASGVPPQHGLYTAIIAGGLIALTGGSKVQVSGPTAAFVVILAPIAAKFGLGGLMIASVLAGVILLLLGIARMGRLIEFIPHPVTTGFTTGIAVVIVTLQIRDFLGLELSEVPDSYIEKIYALVSAAVRDGPRWPDLSIGVLTLVLLLGLPKLTQRIPAPILALPLGAVVAWLLPHIGASWDIDWLRDFHVNTILTRFPGTHGVPQAPPVFAWPWLAPGADSQAIAHSLNSLDTVRALLGSAFAIAMLGAIESLLSAVVADGMTGTKHDPDAELVGQGLGNIVAPFFGGIAATGAIARTATNIRYGARSPIAAVVHAVFVLVAVLAAAPLLGHLPMASMAALLLIVARNMSDLKHFTHMLRVAPRNDVLVLLACFGLTVLFDMVVAVSTGIVLAALLFMGRMASAAHVTLVGEGHPELREPLPPGMLLYRVTGPLFFGAAHRAMSVLDVVEDNVRVVVLDLRDVPTLDATGLVALESALDKLHKRRIFVVIAGVQAQPLHLMAKAGWKHRPWLVVWRNFNDAIALARTLSESDFAHAGALTQLP